MKRVQFIIVTFIFAILVSTGCGQGNESTPVSASAEIPNFDDSPPSLLIWARQITNAIPGDITVDSGGNLYLTGVTQDLEEGTSEAFIRKYDPEGQEIWTQNLRSRRYDVIGIAFGVSVDKDGSIYIAAPALEETDDNNAVVILQKLNANGNELWIRQIESVDQYGYILNSNGAGVALDRDGNAFTVASIRGDRSVRKNNQRGDELWTRQFGLELDEVVNPGVAVDQDGSVYVTGVTDGILPGQPSAWTPEEIRDFMYTYPHAFLLKFDENGKKVWTRLISSRDFVFSPPYIVNPVVGPEGNVYIATTLITDAGRSFFVRKYDPLGNELWSRKTGTDLDTTSSIAVDRVGNVFIVGWKAPDNAVGEPAISEALIIQYSPNGEEKWRHLLGPSVRSEYSPPYLDEPPIVAVDLDGNVYVASITFGGEFSPDGTEEMPTIFIGKYGRTGTP